MVIFSIGFLSIVFTLVMVNTIEVVFLILALITGALNCVHRLNVNAPVVRSRIGRCETEPVSTKRFRRCAPLYVPSRTALTVLFLVRSGAYMELVVVVYTALCGHTHTREVDRPFFMYVTRNANVRVRLVHSHSGSFDDSLGDLAASATTMEIM